MRNLLFASLLLVPPTSSASDEKSKTDALCSVITNTIGGNPIAAITSIGEPTKTRKITVENPFSDNSNDKEIRLEYTGGYIVFRYVSYSDRYFLVGAKLDSRSFNAVLRDSIPDSPSLVTEQYGDPDKTKLGEYIYYCGIEGNEWVGILHTNEVVTGLNFVGYID